MQSDKFCVEVCKSLYCVYLINSNAAPGEISESGQNPFWFTKNKTTAQMTLLSLYQAALVPILSEWIDIIELGRLDTAVCDHELRGYLTNAMSKCHLTHPEFSCRNRAKVYAWIELRDMGLKEFYFHGSKQSKQFQKSLLSRAKYVNHLEACRGSSVVNASSEKNVTSLSLHYQCFCNAKTVLLKFGFWLQTLYASECSVKSEAQFAVVADCCPHLKTLVVSSAAEVLPVMTKCDIELLDGSNIQHLTGLKGFGKCCPKIVLRRSQIEDDSTLCIADKRYCLIGVEITREKTILASEEILKLVEHVETFSSPRLVVALEIAERVSHSINLREFCYRSYDLNAAALVSSMADDCPNLECLILSENIQLIPDHSISRLFNRCPHLYDYEVSNSKITPSLVHELLKGVESFMLCYMTRNPTSIHRDVENSWNRLTVNLSHKIVQDHDLQTMIGANSQLKKICFQSLRVSQAVVDALKENCSLQVLDSDVYSSKCLLL